MVFLWAQHNPLHVPTGHGRALKTAFGKLMPTPGNATEQRVGISAGIEIGGQLAPCGGHAQALAQSGFEAIVYLINARLQALVFMHQGIPYQDARHTGVFFGEGQQQR